MTVRVPRDILVTFACVTLLVGALGAARPAGAATAPMALGLSLNAAQVGQVLFVDGRGLAGASLQVYVGRAPATGVINPGGNSRRIRFAVPNRIDPLEPDTVPVRVRVDDVEAIYPNGPLLFTWNVPQPSPSLSGYDTGDPERPHSVLFGQPFVITFTGERLTIGQREPLTCSATGASPSGWLTAPMLRATKTEASFAFAGLTILGNYQFHVGFSDGSTALIDAPGFVEAPRGGSPPRIEAARAEVGEEEAICDMTEVVARGLCGSAGIFGVVPEPPGIILEATFTTLDLEARVTDADATTSSSDILLVGVEVGPADVFIRMPDDGSAESTPYLQTDLTWNQDCSNATPDYPGCVCSPATWQVTSNDVAAGDDLYTRRLALINPTTPEIARDCIVAQSHREPRALAPGTLLTPQVFAVDRTGNLDFYDAPPLVTGADGVGCTGDPCGCCLLLSPNPTLPPPTGCSGLDGMTSPDLPMGICHSF